MPTLLKKIFFTNDYQYHSCQRSCVLGKGVRVNMKTKSIRWINLILTTSMILSMSCAMQTRKSSRQTAKTKVKASQPVQQNFSNKKLEYTFGYGDQIEVKFFNNSDYNETVNVRPDGRISLQRVGDIPVVGMTPRQLDDIVTKIYSEILIDPDVTVLVREFGGQDVYVMGEVDKPGKYPVTKGMTLLRAIATAGGPKNTAKLNSIVLMRGGPDQATQATRVNLEMSAIKEKPSIDIPVNAYDVIYVPRTFIADVNKFVGQVYDFVLPPFDVWSRYTIYSGRN